MLECLHRSGRARILQWNEERTPTLLVPETFLGVPDWAVALRTQAQGGRELVMGGSWFFPGEGIPSPQPGPSTVVQVITQDDLAIFHDAGGWASHPEKFVQALPDAKQKSQAKALWAPALGEPANYALYAYLGVDLFDAAVLLRAATRGEVLTVDGTQSAELAASIAGESDWDTQQIAQVNLENARRELALIQHHIQAGTLRHLVERRVSTSPDSVSMLRRFDQQFHYLEAHTPIEGTEVPCMTGDSLWMPEVERFRRKLREAYVAPTADILVLLPCSARKPYARSKTHMYFQRALDDSGVRYRVHEVMVTSPLGLVPRDVEMLYPAAHYDVPVTHHWTRDEEAIIRKQLMGLLDRHDYTHVIAHVGASTFTFLRDLIPDAVHTAHGRPSSKPDCDRLRDTLHALGKSDPQDNNRDIWRQRKVDDARALASMQWSEAAAHAFTAGATAHGRVPFVKIDADKQLGMTTDRGLLSLTLDGANRLLPTGVKQVTMGDFQIKKTGSLFAVGVEGATDDIRPGDDVLVVRDGVVRACGTAKMPGDEMVDATRGVAVHLRHIVKAPEMTVGGTA